MALAYQRAADEVSCGGCKTAPRGCMDPVNCAMDDVAAILALAPADALAEVQALKAERDRAIEDAIYNAQYVDLVSEYRAENTRLRSKVEAAEKLAEASAGVIQRWDSPDWKHGHTGDFITRLRAAVGAYQEAGK